MSAVTQKDYAREIVRLVLTMSIERAAQVYDFARFLKQASEATPSPILADDDDWLNDTPEQIAAEEAVWDAAFARNRDKIRVVAREAAQSYHAGETDELFDDEGIGRTQELVGDKTRSPRILNAQEKDQNAGISS